MSRFAIPEQPTAEERRLKCCCLGIIIRNDCTCPPPMSDEAWKELHREERERNKFRREWAKWKKLGHNNE